jgi:histone deacetylase 1/2
VQPLRASTRVRKPKEYTDGIVRWCLSAISEEPTNLQTALADPKWKEAMDEEYGALMHNQTWRLVPPQRGKNVIDCRWIYKVKHRADGSLDLY